MLQQILTIGASVLHLADYTDKLRMQAMDSKVYGCTFTSLYNLVLKLFLHLGNDLLDACRMNTSVGNKLMQGQTADLTADWVEG